MVKRSEEDKQKRREYAKKRREDPVAREADRLRNAAWRAKNPGYQAKWAAENREKTLFYSRRWHGIVDATGEEKSGSCEICGKHADRLRYDHCHASGEFRGWLCHKCNVGLHYAEDPVWLQSALRYLSANCKTSV